jgi:hypothetical protein
MEVSGQLGAPAVFFALGETVLGTHYTKKKERKKIKRSWCSIVSMGTAFFLKIRI